tara:strand:+ start:4603 stop:4872 length:270 start_codon:yes stop_codon:yes gene_type:complete
MAYQRLQVGRAAAVTPGLATATIPSISTADGSGNNGCILYVGVAGNVELVTVGGDTVTFVGVVAGTFLPVLVKQVVAAGTTASNILACW